MSRHPEGRGPGASPDQAAGMFEERFFRKEFAMRTGTVFSVALGAVVLWMAGMPAISDGGSLYGGVWPSSNEDCPCQSTDDGQCPDVLDGPDGAPLGCQGGDLKWCNGSEPTGDDVCQAGSGDPPCNMPGDEFHPCSTTHNGGCGSDPDA